MTNNIINIFLTMGLITLASCGNKMSSPSPSPVRTTTPPAPQTGPVGPVVEKEELDPGTYKTVLLPVNSFGPDEAGGEFTISIKDDVFMAESQVNGVHGGMKHYQEVLTGEECPDENADANFDGVIDVMEASAVSGNTLLPLDSHLNTQVEGITYGPIANEGGYYFYRRSSSFSLLMEDLLSYDDDPEDHLMKLAPPTKLTLSKKVIMVYGLSPEVELPESVQGRAGLSPHESTPVLCGRLKRQD